MLTYYVVAVLAFAFGYTLAGLLTSARERQVAREHAVIEAMWRASR